MSINIISFMDHPMQIFIGFNLFANINIDKIIIIIV